MHSDRRLRQSGVNCIFMFSKNDHITIGCQSQKYERRENNLLLGLFPTLKSFFNQNSLPLFFKFVCFSFLLFVFNLPVTHFDICTAFDEDLDESLNI